MTKSAATCPHCGSGLKRWRVPDGATWGEEFFLVCFNDECSYYKEGWDWMMSEYSQTASYRFALNPSTGGTLPIPVWSATATRDMIIDDEEESEP